MVSIRSKSSIGVSCNRPPLAYPPTRLTTARSGASGSPAATSATRAASCGSVRSATIRTGASPSGPSTGSGRRRLGATTRHPAAEKAALTALPSPPVAPVTNTLRFAMT